MVKLVLQLKKIAYVYIVDDVNKNLSLNEKGMR